MTGGNLDSRVCTTYMILDVNRQSIILCERVWEIHVKSKYGPQCLAYSDQDISLGKTNFHSAFVYEQVVR